MVLWRVAPERGVSETLIETGICEHSKWECGQEACFLFLVECVCGGDGVVVVGEVVVCETWLGDFVEDEDELVLCLAICGSGEKW